MINKKLENLQLVGRIKNNPSERWKSLKGLTLIVLQIQIKKESERLIVVRPITLEEMERFYKVTYEESMKEIISNDYDYCIWYLLDGDCELTCEIELSDLEDIKEITEEDVAEHNKNLEEFKKLHKVYEYQNRLDEEEKEDEKALEEFKQEEKVEFIARTTKGNKVVDAVIYRGFAIHNNVGYVENSTFKAISAFRGEFKGMKLTSCRIAKYKNLIDEIIETIGYKTIETSDIEKLKKIINKY